MIFILYYFRQRRNKAKPGASLGRKATGLALSADFQRKPESFKGKIAGLPLLKNGQKNSAPVIARLV